MTYLFLFLNLFISFIELNTFLYLLSYVLFFNLFISLTELKNIH